MFELWELDGVFVIRTPEEILAEVGELQPGERYVFTESRAGRGTTPEIAQRSAGHRLGIERLDSSDERVCQMKISEDERSRLRSYLHQRRIPIEG